MAGALYWYQHLGRSDGTESWTIPQPGQGAQAWPGDIICGVPVGGASVWQNYKQVLAADDGVIYGVKVEANGKGALYWHQHRGRSDGQDLWTDPLTGQVGNGIGLAGFKVESTIDWNSYQHVFAADDGVIYGVGVDDYGTPALYWHQHLGRSDGSKIWSELPPGTPLPRRRQVGKTLRRKEGVDAPPGVGVDDNDWNYRVMFAADDGVIYGVRHGKDSSGNDVNGQLFWYRHLGRGDGTESFAEPEPNVQCVHVGNAWNSEPVFAADDDVIYAVAVTNDVGAVLYWWRHLGRSHGTVDWEVPQPPKPGVYNRRVGMGNHWDKYTHVFAAEDGVIYVIV